MKARIDAGIRGTRAVCRVGAETNLRLLNVKKPVIAWIEGAITGAGISPVSYTHLVILLRRKREE